jgi:hypothetical protein
LKQLPQLREVHFRCLAWGKREVRFFDKSLREALPVASASGLLRFSISTGSWDMYDPMRHFSQ